jgi:hypothetical protein
MEQAQVRSLLTECREREERPKSLVGAEKEVYAVAHRRKNISWGQGFVFLC